MASIVLITQVVPDFRGLAEQKNGTFTDEGLQAMSDRMNQVTNPRLMTKELKDRKTAVVLKTPLQANKHSVLAYENAMRSVVPNNRIVDIQAPEFPRKLDQGEQRYLVPIADVEVELLEFVGKRTVLSCIELVDGSVRYENNFGKRSQTFIDADRGSSSWPGYNFIFSPVVRGRGGAVPDILHRRHDGAKNSYYRSGTGVAQAELAILFRYFNGAFGKDSNWHQIRACVFKWHKNTTYRDPMFRFCYWAIVMFRTKGCPPSNFGSEEHMREIFDSLPCSLLWKSIGTSLKLSRWFAFNARQRHFQEHLGDLRLGFLVLGVFEGFFKTLLDMPFRAFEFEQKLLEDNKADEMTLADILKAGDADELVPELVPAELMAEMMPPAMAAEPAAMGPAPAKKQRVAGPYDGTEPFLKGKKRNAQLSCQIVCRDLTLRTGIAQRAFSEPIEEEQLIEMRCLKSQANRGALMQRLSEYSYNDTLFAVLSLLSDVDLCRELLFVEECYSVDDIDLHEDRVLAQICFNLARQLFIAELRNSRYQSCRPPYLFLRLKSEKEDVRKKCYADCRMLREKLYEAEVLAAGKDIFFQAFVRDLQWAGEVFNRECLVTLEECKDEGMTDEMDKDLEALKHGLNSTLCCEETFKHLGAVSSQTPQGFLSRSTRWHRSLTDGIVDNYDLLTPPHTPPKSNICVGKCGSWTTCTLTLRRATRTISFLLTTTRFTRCHPRRSHPLTKTMRRAHCRTLNPSNTQICTDESCC